MTQDAIEWALERAAQVCQVHIELAQKLRLFENMRTAGTIQDEIRSLTFTLPEEWEQRKAAAPQAEEEQFPPSSQKGYAGGPAPAAAPCRAQIVPSTRGPLETDIYCVEHPHVRTFEDCPLTAAAPAPAPADGTEKTAYHWWCPKCQREVDWREGSNEISVGMAAGQGLHIPCKTKLELRKGSSTLPRAEPAGGMPEEPEWFSEFAIRGTFCQAQDYDRLRAYAEHLQARLKRYQQTRPDLPSGCACKINEDDEIVNWCSVHAESRNELQARVKELEQHEPDLIFHDAMHELGASNGETFHALAYRKAEEIKQLMERAEQAEVRVKKLETAIDRVLDDEESRPGGWGPDCTAVGWLREALAAQSEEKK